MTPTKAKERTLEVVLGELVEAIDELKRLLALDDRLRQLETVMSPSRTAADLRLL
jgi:predicted component of type VI protein secretion system